MPSFADVINAKITEKELNLSSAAEAIGVSAVSLRGVLSGNSVPNARSINKYIAFAGISAEEAKALIEAGKAEGGSKKKGGRKAGAKAKKGAAKAPKAAKPAKAGRKPRGGAASALAAIGEALAKAESLAGDKLAMTVHGLSASQRKVVAAIVSSF